MTDTQNAQEKGSVRILDGWPVFMTDEDWDRITAARNEFSHDRAEKRKAALAVIRTGGPDENAVRAIFEYTSLFSSEARLDALLDLIEENQSLFWPVMLEVYNDCDDTWQHRSRLLRALRRAGPAPGLQAPEVLQVFRGCSRERIRGISWTTDRHIAWKFARGHRHIPVPNPVIVEAEIPREGIFALIGAREESEVLLDPRRLRRLSVAPLKTAAEDASAA